MKCAKKITICVIIVLITMGLFYFAGSGDIRTGVEESQWNPKYTCRGLVIKNNTPDAKCIGFKVVLNEI